jgi:hypothetical protein
MCLDVLEDYLQVKAIDCYCQFPGGVRYKGSDTVMQQWLYV